MADLNMTPARVELLRAVAAHQVRANRTNGEVYQYTNQRRHRVTGRVGVMKVVGLVEYVNHDDDRTEVDVQPTGNGRRVLADLDAKEA